MLNITDNHSHSNYSMYSLHFYDHPLPKPKVGQSFVLAIAAHLAVAWLIFRVAETLPPLPLPPPAVMMQWSTQIEAPATPKPLPVGEQQTVSSAASEPQKSAEKQPELPKLTRAEKAKIIVAENKPEPRVRQKQPKPEKPQAITSPAALASAASSAAPMAQSQPFERVSAPINSDANAKVDAKISWESLVRGHLNRFKRYPAEAQARNRTGTVWVEFTLDYRGNILSSKKIKSSGTQSLDREAMRMLEKSQPLPIPPESILYQGRITVTLPIDFSLINQQ
ncbi:energy transducer TonB [Yersinia nurmii]|uniref:Energy transducer TonB n=2 Tax=Yersinia nurmii TaxID=685706 RepID=A0AAW7JWR5_9GAMM|nr:energy transducer TonB [Yersinia nurmii]MDN0087473.1 energy transducer TonB [Yersinia nurmii]